MIFALLVGLNTIILATLTGLWLQWKKRAGAYRSGLHNILVYYAQYDQIHECERIANAALDAGDDTVLVVLRALSDPKQVRASAEED